MSISFNEKSEARDVLGFYAKKLWLSFLSDFRTPLKNPGIPDFYATIYSPKSNLFLSSKKAKCSDTFGSFECTCNDGFEGNGLNCTNINECEKGLDDCNLHANCSDTEGTFTCTCLSGYYGDGITCENINECDSGDHNCSEQAKCSDNDGSFSCDCNEGFFGDGNECADLDECSQKGDTLRCDSNANCTNNIGSFRHG